MCFFFELLILLPVTYLFEGALPRGRTQGFHQVESGKSRFQGTQATAVLSFEGIIQGAVVSLKVGFIEAMGFLAEGEGSLRFFH